VTSEDIELVAAVGSVRLTIPATPRPVNSTPAQFLEIEVNGPRGRVSWGKQERFLELVRAKGGLAVLARSVDDLLDL
jgi:hypothetical protein